MNLRPTTRRVTGSTIGLALATSGLAICLSSAPAQATSATGLITGHVTTTPMTGTPVISTGLDVWLFTADDVFVHDTVTDPQGDYAFVDLPAGAYKIRFENQNEGIEEWWENTPTMEAASALTVGKGEQVVANAHISAVAENLVAPVISGTAAVGSTLSTTLGSWYPSLGGPIAHTVEWLRNGTPINGASGTSYTVTGADAGAVLQVRVTASLDGMNEVGTSLPTAAVTGGATPAIVVQSAPSIVGTPAVGSTLTAASGSWLPADATFSYQWLRDDVPIPGATRSTYPVTTADAGARLTVRLVAAKAGYASATATSPARVVPAAPVALTAPALRGTARVGATITTSIGTWSTPVTGVRVQWLRNGVVIRGATSTSYRITAADARRRVQARITVDGGSALSNAATVTAATTKAKLKLTGGKQQVKISLKLTSAGTRTGKATVTVKVGARTVKRTVVLRNGQASLVVKKLKRGKATVRATYSGDASSASAKATAKVAVR